MAVADGHDNGGGSTGGPNIAAAAGSPDTVAAGGLDVAGEGGLDTAAAGGLDIWRRQHRRPRYGGTQQAVLIYGGGSTGGLDMAAAGGLDMAAACVPKLSSSCGMK